MGQWLGAVLQMGRSVYFTGKAYLAISSDQTDSVRPGNKSASHCQHFSHRCRSIYLPKSMMFGFEMGRKYFSANYFEGQGVLPSLPQS